MNTKLNMSLKIAATILLLVGIASPVIYIFIPSVLMYFFFAVKWFDKYEIEDNLCVLGVGISWLSFPLVAGWVFIWPVLKAIILTFGLVATVTSLYGIWNKIKP